MNPTDDNRRAPHGREASRAAIVRGAAELFAREPYAAVRIKDIAAASRTSTASVLMAFRSKEEIARAVLDEQQARMKEVLDASKRSSGTALQRLIATIEGLGRLISEDWVVQAGICLAHQPGTGLEAASRSPYSEWILVADELIATGIVEGSVRPEVQVSSMAQTLNEIFVGAQALAGLESEWKTLPDRLARTTPLIEVLLRNPASASRSAGSVYGGL